MLRDGSVETEGEVEATWCGVEREPDQESQCASLHRRLKRIVKARGALDVQEAEALREAKRLRLWRHYGYASLLEYMELEMGYTPRAALERLRVANAIAELPAIADAMAQGDLSFSAGRELTRVATPETEQNWLEAASDKNVRQVERLVSGHKRGDEPTDPPDPTLRKRRLRFDDIDEETVALLRQAREILDREQGERTTDQQFLRTFARMIVDGAAAPERTRAAYQSAVTVCAGCKKGWLHAGGLVVEMSPPTLEAALCDAQHIGSVDDDECRDVATSQTASSPIAASQTAAASTDNKTHVGLPNAGPRGDGFGAGVAQAGPDRPCAEAVANRSGSAERARQDIPPALRRKVNHRDQGKCRVPWCRSWRNIDQHHIKPVSQGGTHALENLLTLCESHHLAHHAGALLIDGTASTAKFTRRAHNSFAIAERAVETASALKGLGFDKHEVKAAMEKTRTHVGTTELTLQQWIVIALSYCPKPRSA